MLLKQWQLSKDICLNVNRVNVTVNIVKCFLSGKKGYVKSGKRYLDKLSCSVNIFASHS